jgi:hypothetical protein
MDALRRKFEQVKSVKQPEQAGPAQTRPRGSDKPLKGRETKDPLDRLNGGYVRANFRRALRRRPSIPAGT